MVRINLRSRLITSILLFAALCPSTFGKTIYVDDNAVGANDGTSWENAYNFLQDALSDANDADKPVEIRVAHGIYKPDQGANQMAGDRQATFLLLNDVTIQGGYAGLLEADPNARDIAGYETVLSGDLNGDDVDVNDLRDLLFEPSRIENSYHVVMGSLTDNTAVLDGFVICGGNTLENGAGMLNESGSPTVSNCTFIGNMASHGGGGGMCIEMGSPIVTSCVFSRNFAHSGGGIACHSSPTIINCTVSDNLAMRVGGGIACDVGNPKIQNCFITNNTSISYGGGLYCIWSDALIADCIIAGNWSWHYGGGIFCEHTPPTIRGCLIDGNWAFIGGGGIDCLASSPTITNCKISNNTSIIYHGGGIYSGSGSPKVSNCIISGNSAYVDGGGIHCFGAGEDGGFAEITNCTFSMNSASSGGGAVSCQTNASVIVKNCILWGNYAPSGTEICVDTGSASLNVLYTNVQGGQEGAQAWAGSELIWGEGNIDADPHFADLRNHDYYLKSQAGRWGPNSESWVVDDVTSPCIDAGDPNSAVGDEPEPNGGIINMGAYGGTDEASMSPGDAEEIVYIQWLGHSTVKVWTEDCIVYVDPERVPETLHDATLVCVTHTHSDHYSPTDIAKVSNDQTQFVAPPDVVQLYGSGQTIAPGQTIEFDFVTITAVPAYNINKSRHPKSNNWVGYIIELGSKRIYVAGDTDLIEEMKSLGDIDVAFLPAGGTFTMDATEAAEATGYIKPDLAIPYHWGQSVGTLADAQRFAELARCPAMVLTVGEMIISDNWPVYSPLIAHWTLDEAEGDIAHDSVGENHGTLEGGPAWQPAGGKINGALQLDGIDDYISTDFVLDPANGSFSVYTWIKSDSSGGVVISQADGTGSGENWLGADPLLGKLMTGLVPPAAGRFVPQALVSESVITDGQWHHIGFAWDGSYRTLYMDGTKIAKDATAQNPLKSADGGMYIGAGKTLDAVTFFSGKIDDVRIYNVALTADEIDTLVH